MIRQALLAASLLAASTGALATDFGHVERHVLRPVEHLTLSVGSLLHDGFNITYGIGGHRHENRSHSSRVIVVPPPVRVIHRHRHESRHSHWNRHDHGRRAWRDHDRHDDRRGWGNKRRGDDRWDDRRGRDRNRSRH
ncbi:MAG TPA: hypothetical protein VIS73_09815 [Rhodocyclaceae bacterium]